MSVAVREHNDHRGNLLITQYGDMSCVLLETKAGKYRGGESHNEIQHCILLVGKAKMHFKQELNGEESIEELKIGKVISIPKGIVHLFHSITDSFMVEWHGAGRSTEYYQPWRKKCKV